MEKQEEHQDWSIGQLARFGGISVKTVRFYSDAGLLPPRRNPAGHRRYGPADLARLTVIRGLRSLDVGLEKIGELLAGMTDLQQCLAVQEQVLDLRLRTVGRQLAVCRAMTQDATGDHTARLQAMTKIEAAERDRLIERFWDDALSTTADPADRSQMRMAGTPELPARPSAEQLDAWLALTELAADLDFRTVVRRTASWFSDNVKAGFDPTKWPDLLQGVCGLAEPLIAAGVQPDDERAAPAVNALTRIYAEALDKTDTADFRRWLSEQLDGASDPRAARWWQLVAVIQPPPTGDGTNSTSEAAEHRRRARCMGWLNTGLRLHSRSTHTNPGNP